MPGGDGIVSPGSGVGLGGWGPGPDGGQPEKAAKRFAEALCTRTQTDAVDAAVLAEFAQRMPFEPWQRPDRPALELRTYARRLAMLVGARTQAKNPLHALSQSTTTPAMILEEAQRLSRN